jgi:CRP-like cAMP-binding protein
MSMAEAYPLLSTVEVSEVLESLAEEARSHSSSMRGRLTKFLRPERLEAGVDLMTRFGGDVVFIDDGMLKLCQDGKLIRFFMDGDLVSYPRSRMGILAESDFVTELSVCSAADFAACMTVDPDFAESSLRTLQCYEEVMAGLCAAASAKRVEPASELKRYEDREVILSQGSDDTDVLVMVMGQATVKRDEIELATINSDEMFGEMSLLTGEPRSADVIADGVCLVQRVSGDDFRALLASRPSLAVDLAKTLARRIAATNLKVTG